MRFGTVGGRFVLERGGRVLDVARASGGSLPSDAVEALERWDDVLAWEGTADWSGAFDVSPRGARTAGAPARARSSRSR